MHDAGANVNAVDPLKRTSLFATAICNQAQGVGLLLDRGANVQLRDQNGLTAASLAVNNGNSKAAAAIKDWLVNHQADNRK